MRICGLLNVARRSRPRRGGTGRPVPVRLWPEEATLWLDENGVLQPRAARHALAALAVLGRRGRYAARSAGGGKVVAGPASVLALRDAEAEIHLVFRVTPDGYGAEDF